MHANTAFASDTNTLRSSAKFPRPSLLWAATQLAPSPELLLGSRDGMVHSGLRWQVTPLAYSFGINRATNPWRTLVVEPLARHSGSIELYVAPELVFFDGTKALLRPGIRAYAPLFEHGEALSVSIGSSYQRFIGRDAVALEAGVYFLFGILGVQWTQVLRRDAGFQTSLALSVRYF
jgi:hypothetical protein